MVEETKSSKDDNTPQTLVTADFGGRRKIFDRRLKQMPIRHKDRRRGRDRRSGFDRRSSQNQDDAQGPLKRKSDKY